MRGIFLAACPAILLAKTFAQNVINSPPGCQPGQPSFCDDQMASLKGTVTSHCNASTTRDITLQWKFATTRKEGTNSPLCISTCNLSYIFPGNCRVCLVIINTKFTCCIYETKFKCFIQLGDVIIDRSQPYTSWFWPGSECHETHHLCELLSLWDLCGASIGPNA